MKRLEDLLHSLRNWHYKRQGFTWHHDKRMWTKSRSECCNATVQGKTLFKGKPLKKPFTAYSKDDKPFITFNDFCSNCDKRCKVLTLIKH